MRWTIIGNSKEVKQNLEPQSLVVTNEYHVRKPKNEGQRLRVKPVK